MSNDCSSACDVIGCEAPSSGTYMDGVSHPRYRFLVCEGHKGRLLRGEQPAIVAERIDLAQMYVRPALILE